MTIDRGRVTHAAVNGIPLVITTHKLPPQTEVDLEEILMVFLDELGQEELKDLLAYCLRELTGNAKKANTKRVYFKEKALDLNNPGEYDRGMENFKLETVGNIQHYLDLQEQEDLYIKISFLIRNNVLYLSVRNNAPITSKELTRVFDRVARSRAFDSMEEAFGEILDETEGAGLGIVILILTLRKMGLTEKSFGLTSTETETTASLTIPMGSARLEGITAVAGEYLEVVDDLPPFPENLRELIELLDDPLVDFAALAGPLSRDPGLTADLIKYINSAQFGSRKRVNTLPEAIQIVGIQGLRDLVLPYGAHKLLEKYLEKQKTLWDNAVRVSFYGSELGRELRLTKEAQGLAQVGGILYNMGQILVSFLHPDESARILEFCQAKGFSAELFNNLTQAINPTDIGARIALKWNFPEPLVQVLRFQNRPQGAAQGLQPVTGVVHLAASLVAVEGGLLGYSQIHPGVLKAFGFDTQDKLTAFHTRVKAEFPG